MNDFHNKLKKYHKVWQKGEVEFLEHLITEEDPFIRVNFEFYYKNDIDKYLEVFLEKDSLLEKNSKTKAALIITILSMDLNDNLKILKARLNRLNSLDNKSIYDYIEDLIDKNY